MNLDITPYGPIRTTTKHEFILTESAVTNSLVVSIHQSQIENFKTLVNRALNVWPDAPPELKEFGDLLLEGKILQDYRSQV